MFKLLMIAFTASRSNMMTTIIVLILYAPLLILALTSTIRRNNFKILYRHPSLILLPTFTHFTFSLSCLDTPPSSCSLYLNSSNCHGPKDVTIRFSKLYTWINIVISCLSYTILLVTVQLIVQNEPRRHVKPPLIIELLQYCTPGVIMGIILTITFMYMDQWCKCCVWDCCNTETKVNVYDPNNRCFIFN